MLLNISHKTDIPLFYSDWFFNRISDGYFIKSDGKVNNLYKLIPENFELLIFQTKNPKNMIDRLYILDDKCFNYMFLFSLSPYDNTVEKNVGNKREILNTFIDLSKKIGKERVVWKYSPIIINQKFNVEFHLKSFTALCKKLSTYTDSCLIEFVKEYAPPIHAELFSEIISEETKSLLLSSFCDIAKKYGIRLFCSDKINLNSEIYSTDVLLRSKLRDIANIKTKDLSSLDMGIKNTCMGDCEYCTCGGNNKCLVTINNEKHMPTSPQLIGNINKRLSVKHPKISKIT